MISANKHLIFILLNATFAEVVRTGNRVSLGYLRNRVEREQCLRRRVDARGRNDVASKGNATKGICNRNVLRRVRAI